MKVLLCTPYNLSEASIGGISVWAKNIVDYHQCHPGNIELNVLDCTRIHSVNENTGKIKRLFYGIVDYYDLIKRIYIKSKREHYEIVHINTTASLGCIKDIILCRLLRRMGIKVFLHYHFGRIPQLAIANNIEWKMISKSIKLAHRAIVMDHSSLVTLKENGFENVAEIPNPYSPELELLVKKLTPLYSRTKHRILFLSRVFKKKGIYELVQACRQIPNIELRIVGPYEEIDKNRLLEIAGHGDWIHFIGTIKHENVVKEYLQCDLFVLPTYTEGFPNAILETMLCKTPTIVTPVGAIPQMLDFDGQPCGISIRPRCVEDIVDAIQKLLDNDELKRTLTERGLKRVKELYSVKTVCKQLFDAWNN